MTDLRAASGIKEAGLGPIGQAAAKYKFDEIVLIGDMDIDDIQCYINWLKVQCTSEITLHTVDLTSPTNFGEIYETASRIVAETQKRVDKKVEFIFHLSPGTPAMAAVWIIIAKTRFPATLIESSMQEGVRLVSIPFDISAEFIPDLLRGPDKRLEQLSAGLPPETPEFDSIIHRTQVMHRVIIKAYHVAPRSVPVLIEGESGTGKELLARAIHGTSPRNTGPFVAINCGAIPSELIESELFGHVKGAFTGADRQKMGYFEAANQGTLFLDEIGELPLSAQVKLLRAIQEKEVVRIGATKAIQFDVRIIAATNRNLIDEINSSRFRSDLFYRIAVAVLKLPPLRERKGDISLLIDRLLKSINYQSIDEPGYKKKIISSNARNIMIEHQWPGNVRELQNTLRRAAIWSRGSRIDVNDIREALLPIAKNKDNDLLGRSLGDGFNISGLMGKLARHYLRRALNEATGNKTKAAELLGISNYQTLANWMKKYGVE